MVVFLFKFISHLVFGFSNLICVLSFWGVDQFWFQAGRPEVLGSVAECYGECSPPLMSPGCLRIYPFPSKLIPPPKSLCKRNERGVGSSVTGLHVERVDDRLS